jgi:PKD repeat protein
MASISGLMGGLLAIGGTVASGSFPASVTVRGAVNANFDAKLIVQAQNYWEFDAKLCVEIQGGAVAPSAVIQLPTFANSSGLPPFTVTFSGIGSASGEKTIVDHTWFFNDMNTTVSGAQVTSHTFSQSGSYIVTYRVMDSDGLMGFSTIRINTHSGVALALPGLTTSGSPQGGGAPLYVDFRSAGSGVAGTTILGYSWNFGHGRFSKRQHPSGISFNAPGTYVPVCTIIDSRGVIVADTIEIGVNL